MTSGEAVFQSKTDVSAAQIQKATLSVDFDRARFATNMTLSSAKTGAVGLSASGKINDEGIFTGVTPDQRVAATRSFHALAACPAGTRSDGHG